MRKNIYIDEETAARLAALSPQCYPSESEAIRVAVEALHRRHFKPTSDAPDEVLSKLSAQLHLALRMVDGELERRSEAKDD